MKKLILLLLAFFYAISLFAAPVSEETAKQIAENYFKSNNQSQSNEIISLSYKCISQQTNTAYKIMNNDLTYYYVFNKGTTGFIILSADDNTYPVLAYSNEGSFKPDNLPQNVAKWLEGYKQQIRYVIENKIQATDDIKKEWNEWLSGKDHSDKLLASVSPLIQTEWAQSPYVNDLCPYDYNYQERTLTGCTATAMAQIMKFYEYPKTGTGFYSYNHPEFGTLSANFGSTSYDWNSMPDKVSGSNNAVAILMYHCGVSVDMNYGVKGSSAYVISSDSPEHCAEYAYKTYFGYSPTLQGLRRANFTDYEWKNLLKTELNEGRPIQYVGFEVGKGGHTFVCDGYDNNDYFHMNWGWGGQHDAYCNLNALNPNIYKFNDNQQALIGIKPPANSISYNMSLYENVTPSSNPLWYASSLTIHTNITNNGTNTFNGDYCAAIFDQDYAFVDFIKILTGYSLPGDNHYTSGLDFTTNGLYSVIPGSYYIGIFYRPTGSDWMIIGDGSYSNLIPLEVEYSNDIELYASMIVSLGNTIVQNQSFDVTLDIANTGVTDFNGDYNVSLYNLDWSFAETIEIKTGMSLASDNHYTNGLTFKSSSGVSVEPGTYLMTLAHKPNGGNLTLTGSRYYTNPIKVIVQEAPYQADVFEPNNTESTAYKLPVNFNGNNTLILTTGSNCHTVSDYDYYEVNLPSGYDYTITARTHDLFNSGNGQTYTIDVLWSYLNGGAWSMAYDDVMTSNIYVSKGGTVKFHVAPYFQGETGTYLLDLNISRSPIGSVNERQISDIFDVYPNPASEYFLVDFSKYNHLIPEIRLQDILGNIYFSKYQFSEKKLHISTSNLSTGTYFIILIDNDGNFFTKKVLIQK